MQSLTINIIFALRPWLKSLELVNEIEIKIIKVEIDAETETYVSLKVSK